MHGLCSAHSSHSRRRRKEDTRFLTQDGNNSTELVLGSMIRDEAARSGGLARLGQHVEARPTWLSGGVE
jgi:hypothetical protein